MSLKVSGPVPDAICEGDAAGGDPAVPEEVWDAFCSRSRMEARMGTVSIASGFRPSGKLSIGVGGWAVEG